MRKAPPPLLPILAGKPHTLAIPTADPTADSTKPQPLENCRLFLSELISISLSSEPGSGSI
jgi:hypothetical protein